ncbi:alpha/beta fold hydrolase [uncultured Sphingomonas sp.]|uniref:alpha/beta fold hydrolase n=1 Tax=uncultured Sphingomonas sp. TaxID=158754 RepID=UPI0035CB1437
MIRHWPLRIAAGVLAPLLLLHPVPSHARAIALPEETRLAHISVVKIGHGDPVVLIPGLSSPRYVWDGVAPDLARTHTVYLVQINGFAGDAPGANITPGLLEGIVADLDTYLAREKAGAVPVVGHSLGGLVALMTARAHPARVSRLMIVDSLPYIGLLFSPAATVPLVEPQAKTMRNAIAATYGKPADPDAAERTANSLALKPGSRAAVKAYAMAADPRVTAEALYEDMTTDLRPDLPRIAVPITLVYPAPAAGPDRGETLYKGAYATAPHVVFVPIADSAHFVMLDQPAAFRAALDAFLAA